MLGVWYVSCFTLPSLCCSLYHSPSSLSPSEVAYDISDSRNCISAGEMKLITRVLQPGFRASQVVRNLSTYNFFPGMDDKQNNDTSESIDDFENRIFGDGTGNGENSSSFFHKLDRVEKAHDRSGLSSNFNARNRSESFDGLDESFNTLSDGMDGKLKEACTYFKMDEDELDEDDYSFRPDLDIKWGMVLDTKDLDLRRPAVPKPTKNNEFETTTEEVLQKADFRNVRFLANFITEAGIIIKRSQTKISAKAQRKVAREIKTARAFGLMPFTTMGTKQFVYGKTMEDQDEDFEFETYDSHSFVDVEGNQDPVEA